MPRGRPKGKKDSCQRRPRRGSESSRILERVLGVQASGGGLSLGEQRTLTHYALREFEREQQERIRRLLDQSSRRVRDARRASHRENERGTRYEAVVSFDLEVRGSCGSDYHARPA